MNALVQNMNNDDLMLLAIKVVDELQNNREDVGICVFNTETRSLDEVDESCTPVCVNGNSLQLNIGTIE